MVSDNGRLDAVRLLDGHYMDTKDESAEPVPHKVKRGQHLAQKGGEVI